MRPEVITVFYSGNDYDAAIKREREQRSLGENVIIIAMTKTTELKLIQALERTGKWIKKERL